MFSTVGHYLLGRVQLCVSIILWAKVWAHLLFNSRAGHLLTIKGKTRVHTINVLACKQRKSKSESVAPSFWF